MQQPIKPDSETTVGVSVWDREPGTVVEISISKPLSLEQMDELAHLTRSTIKMLLKLPGVADKC